MVDLLEFNRVGVPGMCGCCMGGCMGRGGHSKCGCCPADSVALLGSLASVSLCTGLRGMLCYMPMGLEPLHAWPARSAKQMTRHC